MERKTLLAIALFVAIGGVGLFMFLGGGGSEEQVASDETAETEDGEPSEDGKTGDNEEGEESDPEAEEEEEREGPSVTFMVTAAESSRDEKCVDAIKHLSLIHI